MKWRLVQFSVVVVGDAHNPTILNPDFLASRRIVPKSWGWEVAETITTPPLAMVRYENGVNVTVEQNKIQIADPNVEDGPERSKITEIAAAYVEILPHVRYTAVGNNFQGLIPQPNPGDYLKERFFKEGEWTKSPSDLDAVGLKLSYPLVPAGRLVLAIDAAEATLPNKDDHEEVVVCNANFSRDCGDHPASDKAVEHLNLVMRDWNTYKQALKSLFELDMESRP